MKALLYLNKSLVITADSITTNGDIEIIFTDVLPHLISHGTSIEFCGMAAVVFNLRGDILKFELQIEQKSIELTGYVSYSSLKKICIELTEKVTVK
jgi:hypothetical protein